MSVREHWSAVQLVDRELCPHTQLSLSTTVWYNTYFADQKNRSETDHKGVCWCILTNVNNSNKDPSSAET